MQTLNEYQIAALRTAPKPTAPEEDLMHAAAGVCTEGGELMDVFKKFHFYGKPIDWTNVEEEIGDVLWYLALACRASGTTLEAVAEKNIAKLKARYPDKFTNFRAINRDLEAERKILENEPHEMD
jgi:NTP pyrophosphatase (non-canonical NTP hydrolase)